MKTDLREIKQRLNLASLHVDYALGRFYAQVEFAAGLCGLHPQSRRAGTAWGKLIDEAVEHVAAPAAAGKGDLGAAVAEAERIMAPIGKAAKRYTVHCVGHAHIDMNWKWDWPETVAVTNDTFTTVLRLMAEYPEFHFSQSQASVYAIARKYNPRLMDGIRRRVKEGRWEVTASHWVEGDKNMVGAESLCRHLLYARRFMQDEFGLSPEDVPIDWHPDTFGHPVTAPTYLARGAVKYYYSCHPGSFGPRRPAVFWWKGPDGSRILVCNDNDKYGYNNYVNPDAARHLLEFCRETGLRDFMHVYGVGDHGGGPTRQNILSVLGMNAWPIYPSFVMTTARAYFERVEAAGDKLPTFDLELNYCSPGCYTSNSRIKLRNRRAGNQLCAAEAAATLAWALFGEAYPADQFREGWQDTLFQHFHDILPGCNVHDSQEYVSGKNQDVAAMTGMVETQALRYLASHVDTSACLAGRRGDEDEIEPGMPLLYMRCGMGAGVGFESGGGRVSQYEAGSGGWPRKTLIFNPTAHERGGVAIATVWETDTWCAYTPLEQWGTRDPVAHIHDSPFSVRTPSGRLLPGQLVETAASWFARYARIAFPIEPVGGFGCGLYTVLPEASGTAVGGAVKVTRLCTESSNYSPVAGGWLLENDLVRVQIGSITGAIHSLVEKKSGLDVVDPTRPAAALEFALERCNNSSAWTALDRGEISRPEIISVARTASGPYIGRVEIKWRINDSEFATRYELRKDDPNVYISLEGLWREWGREGKGVPSLKMAVPLALADPAATYEIPFGSLARADHNGMEVPALRWARVTGSIGDRKAGCLLVNDCKNGHSLTDDVLRVSLIRGTYDPDPMPEIGSHSMNFALRPFAGAMGEAEATRLGAALANPLRVVGTDIHKGKLPPAMAPFSAGPKNVVVSAFKKAESEDALVVRLIEQAGRKTAAKIRLDKAVFGAVKQALAADLMERPLAGAARLATKDNTITVPVCARGIATVLVRLKRPAAGR